MPPIQERAPLRDAILDHLRTAGSDSISGIARVLRQHASSAPVHRLTVAGYLAALADEGVLKEVERPPSKHYQIADPDRSVTLHQRLGAIIADMDVPSAERPTLAIAALQHILGRPVFQAELHHAGFQRYGAGIESVEVPEDERREYRALFRRHVVDMEIPHGDPLLAVRPGAVGTASVQETLRRLLWQALPGVTALMTERGTAERAVQSRLHLEGPQ